MLVVYTGNGEVLITEETSETRMLAEFFHRRTGRDIEDYDREEMKGIEVSSNISVHQG